MTLTDRQLELFDFVKDHHGEQKRKYSNAPYWTHLLAVAEIVNGYSGIELGIEIALCHDLLEDTKCTSEDLEAYLLSHFYNPEETQIIVRDVIHLTDQYTHEAYPDKNRAERKKLEAERLIGITANAQSVKYADVIDNTSSIVKNDPGFARVYIKEIAAKIHQMNKGNQKLYKRCLESVDQAVKELKIVI